jgi:hypothetical protein
MRSAPAKHVIPAYAKASKHLGLSERPELDPATRPSFCSCVSSRLLYSHSHGDGTANENAWQTAAA